jgi:hypothetical protein
LCAGIFLVAVDQRLHPVSLMHFTGSYFSGSDYFAFWINAPVSLVFELE